MPRQAMRVLNEVVILILPRIKYLRPSLDEWGWSERVSDSVRDSTEEAGVMLSCDSKDAAGASHSVRDSTEETGMLDSVPCLDGGSWSE